MFGITLIDHLRMTFGSVVRHHEAHLRMARSRVLWSRGLRALEALLMIGAAMASIQAASGTSARAAVVAAAFAILALAALILHLTFDLERSAQAHASCAARLWQIREQYRALLSDLADGAIDIETTRRRRDELIGELQAVYQTAPFERADRLASRAVESVEDAALTDREIDRFLPASLQKGETPQAVA
jgi:hypothetical protein